MQLCGSLNILWQCFSLGLEWKPTFSSPVATAEFSKFAGIWSVALLQHHLLGFEITQLEFHHHFLYSLLFIPLPQWFISIHATLVFASTYCQGSIILSACKLFPPRSEIVLHSSTGLRSDPGYFPWRHWRKAEYFEENSLHFSKRTPASSEVIIRYLGKKRLFSPDKGEGMTFASLQVRKNLRVQYSQICPLRHPQFSFHSPSLFLPEPWL